MKKSNLLFPTLAMFLGIAGAFASGIATQDIDYYVNASSQCVESPTACAGGSTECFVTVNSSPFRVYEDLSGSTCENVAFRP